MSVSGTAERLAERLHLKQPRPDNRLEAAMERLAVALEDAPDRISDSLRPLALRGREAVEAAPAVAERWQHQGRETAERLGVQGRETAERLGVQGRLAAERAAEEGRVAVDRVTRFLEENIDEDTLRSWGPPLAYGLIGFVLGLLFGWLIGRRRDDDGTVEAADDQDGLAQAPRDRMEFERDGNAPLRPTEVPSTGGR